MNIKTKFAIGEKAIVKGQGFGNKIDESYTIVTISHVSVNLCRTFQSVEYCFEETSKQYYEEYILPMPTIEDYKLVYYFVESDTHSKIKEIKRVRSLFSLSLKESKEFVELKHKIKIIARG